MFASHTFIAVGSAVFVAVVSHTALGTLAQAVTQETPVGTWRVIDDKSDRAKGIVEISEVNGELKGKVVRVLDQENQTGPAICKSCPGELKGEPIEGMTVLWGFEREGDQWADGKILDPSNGRIYSASLQMDEAGEKLDVRGYVGISWLGRTQVWERADEAAELENK
ncbi:conserved hypothetical protein [Parvibaculum lavamentivorans DS-1]|uniref:DUF2147 domain-containing protein n=1 Tax=Parvibaculum lavamentivorans (strain DS-1 / DSM 13023 / NCIMB 13966) TaxID=402881 RepID=A7HWH4_PARL1|nr:DUF2147 domain-containing protein [Parvibaculum lavamentivorans]ABS64257.1 conserved hypothetical protein [Parvibaculum lavamentivorans DS-1]